MNFETFDDARIAAKKLTIDGWSVLRYDEPRRCSFGYMAYRTVGGKEETQGFFWRPFGDELRTYEFTAKNATEFKGYLRDISHVRHFRCDNPAQRLIGLVGYDVQTKTCTIVQMPITQLQNSDDQLQLDVRIQLTLGIHDAVTLPAHESTY